MINARGPIICLPVGQLQNVWYPCGFGLACSEES